jgi:hypothetical protein
MDSFTDTPFARLVSLVDWLFAVERECPCEAGAKPPATREPPALKGDHGPSSPGRSIPSGPEVVQSPPIILTPPHTQTGQTAIKRSTWPPHGVQNSPAGKFLIPPTSNVNL